MKLEGQDDAERRQRAKQSPFSSRLREVDAIVNLLTYALRWVEVLDRGDTALAKKLSDALKEAVIWRNSLTN